MSTMKKTSVLNDFYEKGCVQAMVQYVNGAPSDRVEIDFYQVVEEYEPCTVDGFAITKEAARQLHEVLGTLAGEGII